MLSQSAIGNLKNFTRGGDEKTTAETLEFLVNALSCEGGEALVEDAFYRDLEFGTGGLRGIMGPGTNRMNTQVVAKATQGLAAYVKKAAGEGAGIAIAHDSRLNSEAFAKIAAQVIAGNGLKAYLFEDMRPTPELSFAVRFLKCAAGIVITASHNPKEYNGYKVSWSDGAQVTPPHDTGIIDEVRAVSDMDSVCLMDFDSAVAAGKIVMIGEQVDKAFLAAGDTIRVRRELTEKRGGELKIVYTPLHGTGITMVPKALAAAGFTSVVCEPKQSVPDGTFPTTKSPNPEERVALELALALADKEGADVVIATDPDADRVGSAVRHNGEMTLITGNQLGALLAYYVCKSMADTGTLPTRPSVVTTIVTTRLAEHVAKSFGVQTDYCLTGFKWIAGVMRDYELNPDPTDGKPRRGAIMGFEESYGYLFGTHVRDKDAVSSATLVCEMALWAKTQGLSLIDMLHKLFCDFGVHLEQQVSLTMPGKTGMEQIAKLMAGLRSNPPRQVAGIDVVKIDDIDSDTTTSVKDGTQAKGPGLPKSNVLGFYLADGSLVYARPSGTEPKVKFYMMVVDRDGLPFSTADLPARIQACEAKRDRLAADFRALAEAAMK